MKLPFFCNSINFIKKVDPVLGSTPLSFISLPSSLTQCSLAIVFLFLFGLDVNLLHRLKTDGASARFTLIAAD